MSVATGRISPALFAVIVSRKADWKLERQPTVYWTTDSEVAWNKVEAVATATVDLSTLRSVQCASMVYCPLSPRKGQDRH